MGSGKGRKGAQAFCDFVNELLRATVMDKHDAVGLHALDKRTKLYALGGRERVSSSPLRLNDDSGFLRLTMQLRIDHGPHKYLKVATSCIQYQRLEEDSDKSWVFRYDYFREKPDYKYPLAHLHINGNPCCSCLPDGKELRRVHFPSGRVSIESVIRLLVDHFDVPCNKDEHVWRPLLEKTERRFWEVAHQP